MSVQHTNFNTNQDKGKTGQEVTKPDNTVASIFLSAAFYLALAYLASTLLAYDPAWRPFRVTPFLISLLVTVGTVMFKQDNEQTNK